MGIIYRPHRGGLAESMEELKYFDSFEDLQKYIVEDMKQFIKLRPEEVVPAGKICKDERVGWIDSDYLCIDKYANVEDKEGYKRYFGGVYTTSLCIGTFATQWNRDQPNGIKKNTMDGGNLHEYYI